MMPGRLFAGTIKPERATSSIASAKTNSIACCCVRETNEMRVPQPICTRMKGIVSSVRSNNEPRIGIPNQAMTTPVINRQSTMPISKVGIALPAINSR